MARYITLKEAGKIVTGNTPSTSNSEYYCSDDICFVKPSDISNEGITNILSSDFYISENARQAARIIPKNSILVTCIGIIGKVGVLQTEAAINQQINAIIPDPSVVDSLYLAYALESKKAILQNQANAAVVPIINKKQFSSIEIPCPDLEEQKETACKLSMVSNLILQRKQQLAKLDELVKARFVEMFGDPITNPKRWKIATIGDIATEVRYGTSKPAVDGGRYPYLRMNNLTIDGNLDLADLKYIDISDDEIEKCVVRKGDVLFNRTNSIELVGKTAMFNLDEDMVIAGYIIRVRINNMLLPEVLAQYMNLEVVKKLLRGMAKGAVNQANINAQELQGIHVYLPDIELQKQFVLFKNQVTKSKLSVQNSLEKLQSLKQSFMQKYFE